MKALDKKSFRRITLLIVVSLAVLAGLQLYWVVRMYGDMDRRFAEKATAAMERAAYDELTTRSRAPRKIEMQMSGDGIAPKYSYSVDYDADGGLTADTLRGRVAAIHHSGSVDIDSVLARIDNRGGSNIRIHTISLTAMEEDLSRDDFVRYDSLLAINLARADIELPYRLSVVSTDGELQALGDSVAHPRTFDIPIGSKRASVVRLAIEDPNREFMRD